uniref:Uncharacterized protein n=1 Tax=Panagrolaimus sp. JU765 TaxID=591449 RepID=A0AC34PVS3_9BILA
MNEFNSIHEHGIFWDCVSSEVIPLAIVRNAHLENDEYTSRWRRKCIYKFDDSAVRLLHSAIEAGDAAAREYLFHRFLPQHKAVVFFTVFTFIFAAMSIVIGGCSPCFIPNAVLHVFSLIITLSCSLFGDVFFLLASLRIDNRYVHGVVDVYQQKIGYGFYVHFFAAIVDDYPQTVYDSHVSRQPNGRPATTVVDVPKPHQEIRKSWRDKRTNMDLKRIRMETEA